MCIEIYENVYYLSLCILKYSDLKDSLKWCALVFVFFYFQVLYIVSLLPMCTIPVLVRNSATCVTLDIFNHLQ